MNIRTRTPARRLLGAAAAALVVGLVGLPAAAHADPPPALPASAPDGDNRWQPALDFDTDGCYSTPAIGPDGTLAPGLNTSGALNGNCRDASDLDNTNVYSRSKCNNGWCAYLYAYYFEKDQTTNGCCGHRHDWEHVIVWVEGDTVRHVSASQHGGWDTKGAGDVAFEGDHPKIVYHKDGGFTHAFRFAGFDETPENHYGNWRVSGLVGWENYPAGIRDTLMGADFGSATLELKDDRFANALNGAKPGGIAFDPYA